jgi:hypothetical protein
MMHRIMRALTVTTAATLLVACVPTAAEAPAPTGTPTYAQCVTEDQDGWCVWDGTPRYWDSRSEAERAWDVDTASDR